VREGEELHLRGEQAVERLQVEAELGVALFARLSIKKG
jgi:hypothetical protein